MEMCPNCGTKLIKTMNVEFCPNCGIIDEDNYLEISESSYIG